MAHIAWQFDAHTGINELVDEMGKVIGAIIPIGCSYQCVFRGEVIAIRPDEWAALDAVEILRRLEQD